MLPLCGWDRRVDEEEDNQEDDLEYEYDSTWEDEQEEEKDWSSTKKEKKWQNLNRRNLCAASDMQNYRHYYTGNKEMPNLDFYLNKIPSQPDGVKIEEIHREWRGNYTRLERVHSYIQWLFPLREPGLNHYAVELTQREIEEFHRSSEAKRRLVESYELMLDFYGIKLIDKETGEVQRAKNWQERFSNLNKNTHNNLRITRILKCLGELGFEHYQPPLVHFFLKETLIQGTLRNVKRSMLDYFLFAVRNKQERQKLVEFAFQHYKPQAEFVWCPKRIQKRFAQRLMETAGYAGDRDESLLEIKEKQQTNNERVLDSSEPHQQIRNYAKIPAISSVVEFLLPIPTDDNELSPNKDTVCYTAAEEDVVSASQSSVEEAKSNSGLGEEAESQGTVGEEGRSKRSTDEVKNQSAVSNIKNDSCTGEEAGSYSNGNEVKSDISTSQKVGIQDTLAEDTKRSCTAEQVERHKAAGEEVQNLEIGEVEGSYRKGPEEEFSTSKKGKSPSAVAENSRSSTSRPEEVGCHNNRTGKARSDHSTDEEAGKAAGENRGSLQTVQESSVSQGGTGEEQCEREHGIGLSPHVVRQADINVRGEQSRSSNSLAAEEAEGNKEESSDVSTWNSKEIRVRKELKNECINKNQEKKKKKKKNKNYKLKPPTSN
ncbi:opioid growth factor receptor-like protein 1 [Arapaima gigas]